MSFLDDLLGNTAADASKKAAADTYAKQQAATQGITQFGDQYASKFGDLSKKYQPWMDTGATANDAVAQLIANPSSVRSLPGYQFGLDQGNKSILAGNNATGNLFSGSTGKALEGWGVNYADKTYGDQLARLLGVSQQGLGATGASVATAGQGLTGQLGANQSAYQGNMTSAGTIGQGDIAAANAQTQGMQNLFNMAANGIGTVMGNGGAGKMSSYAKTGMNSLFGGGSPSGYGA